MNYISNRWMRWLTEDWLVNFIWQGIVALVAMVGVRLLTQLAPKDIIGIATLFIGGLGLLRNIVISPVANSYPHFYADYVRRGRANWLVHRITSFAWWMNLIVIILLILAGLGWMHFREDGPTLLVLMVLVGLFCAETAKLLRLTRLSAQRQLYRMTVWTSADSLLLLAGPIVAMLFSKTLDSYLLGTLIGSITLLMTVGFIRFPSPEADKPDAPEPSDHELKQAVMKYGLSIVPLATVSWVSYVGDRYLIGGMMGMEAIAVYAMCHLLATKPLLVINGLLSTLARPMLFDAVGRGDKATAQRVFLRWLGAALGSGAVVVLAMYLLGGFLARLFLAEDYRPYAVTIFTWVSLGYMLSNACTAVESRVLSMMRTGSFILPQAVAAGTNIGINFLLIPRHGINGAAMAVAITYAVQLVILLFALMRVSQPPRMKVHA